MRLGKLYPPTSLIKRLVNVAILQLTKDVLARTASVCFSYPFQVVFLRTAAQFIWKEEVYTGMFDSFKKIYRQEGLRGFYG